jgi:CheY-like chemotaxis protein
VVAFSSYDDELIRRRCRAAGFDVYLSKPATRERIFEILRAVAAEDAVGELASVSAPAPAAAVPGATPAVPGATPAVSADDPVEVSPDLVAMLPKFFESRGALLAELHAALHAEPGAGGAEGWRETTRGIAHKLAGSFGLYGFAWAGGEARAMERAAMDADRAALLARCEQLQRHIERARLALGVPGRG